MSGRHCFATAAYGELGGPAAREHVPSGGAKLLPSNDQSEFGSRFDAFLTRS
jgi:hypothetical protein